MQLSCKKCGYVWEYAGNKHRTSCSKCRTSITIDNGKPMIRIVKYNELSDEQKQVIAIGERQKQSLTNRYVAEVKFPHLLWKDARFIQRMQHLPSLGEEYLVLKVNSEGVLSL